MRAEHAELGALLKSVDDASGSARIAWLFFLALLAYLLVAIASVNHRDLLLNNPVELPFLGISIELDKFFMFAPIGLLLVHFGLYMQHIILARKALRLHELLSDREQADGISFRHHPMRLRVHSYFFTQSYCGGARGKVFAALMNAMMQVSFVVLPTALFLFFQLAFLPYHDNTITNLHRAYLFIDLVIIAMMQLYLGGPRVGDSAFDLARRVGLRMAGSVGLLLLVFFSFFVATFPGERLDRSLRAGQVTSALLDEAHGLFARSLSVTDRDLSIVRTTVTQKREGAEQTTERLKLSLRGRNLRGATFDRSILSGVDLTNSNLEGASLRGVNLRGAFLSCEIRPLRSNVFGGVFERCTKLVGSNLEGADLREADLAGACLDGSKMRAVDLRGANLFKAALRGADLSFAHMDNADLTEAKLQGARLLEAELRGARMRFSQLQPMPISSGGPASLQRDDIDPSSECERASAEFANDDDLLDRSGGTDLTRAKLEFADLRLANLQLADLSGARMIGADLPLAQLQGARLVKTDLRGADLSYASMHGADLFEARLDVARLGHARLHGAVLRRALLRGSHLPGAQLQGADLRYAWLMSADAPQTNFRAADLRCTRLLDHAIWRRAGVVEHVQPAHLRLVVFDEAERQLLRTFETDLAALRARFEQERQAHWRLDRSAVVASDDWRHGASIWADVQRASDRAGLGDVEAIDEGCKVPQPAAAPDGTVVEALVNDVVCADPLTIRFIAKGVAKRLVDSLDPTLFDVVADPDPADFLKALEAKDTAIVEDPKSPPQSCLSAVEPKVVWQLTLAAKLYQVERQRAELKPPR